MPFKSGKSPTDVKENVVKALVKIATKKTQEGLTALAYAIGGNADFYVPVDTNNLMNSREINVVKTASGYRAVIGYYSEYATYLHGNEALTPVWNPRPVPSPGKKTGGYNASATPQWIPRGLADTDVMQVLKDASLI